MTDDTKKAYRGAGRVAFLARLADVQRLLDAGHPMLEIYDQCKGRLGIGYPQFTKYVGRYARKPHHDRHQTRSGKEPQIPSPSPSAEPASQVAAGNGTVQPPQKPARPAKSGFSHNPNSGNDRDDLI